MKNLLFSLMVFTSISYGWVGTVTDSSNGNTIDIRPQADLSDADLSNIDLSGASLSGANLSGATLHSTLLVNADLSGALLSQTSFTSNNMYGVNMQNAVLIGANFDSINAKNGNFANITALLMSSTNSVFEAADFSGADIRMSTLESSNFTRADFSNVLLSGSVLSSNEYENTIFIGSDISPALVGQTEMLTLDGLRSDYLARIESSTNGFISADTVLSNFLSSVDSNNYAALSANIVTNSGAISNYFSGVIESESIARKQGDEDISMALDATRVMLESEIDVNQDTMQSIYNVSATNDVALSNAFIAADTVLSNYFDLTLSTSNYLANADMFNSIEFINDSNPLNIGNNNSNNIIAQIIDELTSDGNDHVYYEHRLGSGDDDKSRLTKVIEEVMGNEYSSAMNEGSYSYRPGQNLGDESQYGNPVSLVARMAQELDGVNLDSNIGSNSTDIAMKRISQEFTSRELQFNTLSNNLQNSFGDMDFNDSAQYAYAAGVHQMVTNNTHSLSSATNDIATNTADITQLKSKLSSLSDKIDLLLSSVSNVTDSITVLSNNVRIIESASGGSADENWWSAYDNISDAVGAISNDVATIAPGALLTAATNGLMVDMILSTSTNLSGADWVTITNIPVQIDTSNITRFYEVTISDRNAENVPAGYSSTYAYVNTENLSYLEALDAAENYATTIGGTVSHLATVPTQAEFNEMAAGSRGEGWMGLSDADEEGNFVWITGEPLNWTNWWGSEPSANDYVHTRGGNGTSGREWMARQNTHRIGYFVEFYVNANGDIY